MSISGFHSFAFASVGSKWLIIGGRINGLHGLNANDPFPQEFANNNIVVINDNTKNYISKINNKKSSSNNVFIDDNKLPFHLSS